MVIRAFSDCTNLLSKSSVPTATLLVDTLRIQRSRMDGLKENRLFTNCLRPETEVKEQTFLYSHICAIIAHHCQREPSEFNLLICQIVKVVISIASNFETVPLTPVISGLQV